MEEGKYTKNDLRKIPEKGRIIVVGLMIANELNNIYSVLKKRLEPNKG
jgi:hypothetical protein